jgi:hypothetical protein
MSNIIERLHCDLTFVGEAPYGSCFQQAAINVLDAVGLLHAEIAPGLTWGFSWEQGSHKLRGGGRWDRALSSLCGVTLRRLRARSWAEAQYLERQQLESGMPVIAGVDSFGIKSPHQGSNHLVHAVIVVSHDPAGVFFCDPMNQPRPTGIGLADYSALRAADCVDRYEMIVCEGTLVEQLDSTSALLALIGDGTANVDDDCTALAAYSRWVAEEDPRELDVADVAAERMYVAKMLSWMSESDGAITASAKTLASLSRRWYLLHTLILEAREGATLKRTRVLRMLNDLREREASARAALRAAVAEPIYEGSTH